MKVHYFQHVPFEGLGSIETWTRSHDCEVTATRFFENERPPAPDAFDWLVIMGGPMGVHDEQKYPWLAAEKECVKRAIEQHKTVLGICLGAQILADVLGARVYPNQHKEIGWFPVVRDGFQEAAPQMHLLPDEVQAFHWHGDTFDLPDGAVHLARSKACSIQAFAYGDRVVGLQFHLETTPESATALIANCGDELVDGPYIQSAEEMLKEASRFERINVVMNGLLDCLAGASVAQP